MNNEIELDPEFMDTVIEAQFNVVKLGWFRTLYYYMIDNQYRTTKRLDEFIQEQLYSPSPELLELVKVLRTQDMDETIINILKWVYTNTVYDSDDNVYNRTEFWSIASNTVDRKRGDCEDQNGLIYVLARLCGIPAYVIYCAIGDVFGGGHFWCIYYSTKHRKLVSIDASYYPSIISIEDRPEFKFSETKYKSIWYLFSDKFIYKYGN